MLPLSPSPVVAPARLPLAQAERIAGKVVAELAPFCEKIEIAGSIRRRRPTCGDLDIVLLPSCAPNITRILERCAMKCRAVKHGDQYCVFELGNGFQLDLWFAHPGEVRRADLFEPEIETAPGNFGVLLLARTGSAAFNVWIAQVATAAGLHFNPHRGIQRGRGPGARVVAATEEAEIFSALQIDWIPPEERER